jgi:hypothetical protein
MNFQPRPRRRAIYGWPEFRLRCLRRSGKEAAREAGLHRQRYCLSHTETTGALFVRHVSRLRMEFPETVTMAVENF